MFVCVFILFCDQIWGSHHENQNTVGLSVWIIMMNMSVLIDKLILVASMITNHIY